MAHHLHYWSIGPFADWIRGSNKLKAGTSKEWYQWHAASKTDHPIRYWIVEEGFDYLQDFVTWPVRKLYDIKYYINNRWVTKTNALTAHSKDIKPGQWRDVGNRFLPCLFNELVDFVEIETAWSHIAWSDKEDRAKYAPPFWASGWFHWRTWRCPQAGIDHLNWASSLVMGDDMGVEKGSSNYGKPTCQAECAKEILVLYTWWTEVYPKRPDIYDASGWSALCERRRISHEDDGFMFEDRTPAEKKETRRVLDLSNKIEKQYNKEDTDMLVRLIKIRNSLWT